MTHEEQRSWMIRRLLDENAQYRRYEVPAGEQEQKDMLRSLMNIRMPKPIGEDFLHIQDEYLTEEIRRADITDIADLQPTTDDERIYLWQGDITELKADAIVNAANSQMCGCFRALHNCVDNIIHSKAGIQLRLLCNDIMQAQGYDEPTGQAKITPAYNLPCKYIIHTVGPIVQSRLTERHKELLASCYRACLELAAENGLQSIAFCCISTGVFGFPKKQAAEIAVKTVLNYYKETGSNIKVVFNVHSNENLDIYQGIINQMHNF